MMLIRTTAIRPSDRNKPDQAYNLCESARHAQVPVGIHECGHTSEEEKRYAEVTCVGL